MFGLGTMGMTLGDESVETMRAAVRDKGYRMFDCASFYGNEDLVGKAIKLLINEDKCVKREDLYIVTKLWWDQLPDPEAEVKKALAKLDLEYIDQILVHWPCCIKRIQNADGSESFERNNIPMHKIWANFEKLVDDGLVKSIGISNFNVQATWDLLTYARIQPVVNQVELHPLCAQEKLLKYLRHVNIQPVGYCPLGQGADTKYIPNLMEHPPIVAMAEKYNKTPAQVLLAWGIARGTVMIPKSNTLARIEQNFGALDVKLEQADVDAITALNSDSRIAGEDPPWLWGCSIFG
jgi:diketogulonate reductase-like aldo/keto reductase